MIHRIFYRLAFFRINRSQHACIFLIQVLGPNAQDGIIMNWISLKCNKIPGVKEISNMPEGQGLLETSVSVTMCWTSVSHGKRYFLLHNTPSLCLGILLTLGKGQLPACSTGWVWPCHWPWRWQMGTFRSSSSDWHVTSGQEQTPDWLLLPEAGCSQPRQNQHSAASLFSGAMVLNAQRSNYLPGETSKETASLPVQLCIRTWIAAFLQK